MVATPANTVAVTLTLTLTNTQNVCLATPCPAGSNVDAGIILPTQITLCNATGTGCPTPAGNGTWALGGTCAVGTAINPGSAGAGVPTTPAGSCTITLTYTPTAGATGTALNGSVRLQVYGYGIDPGTVTPGLGTLFINRVYNAN